MTHGHLLDPQAPIPAMGISPRLMAQFTSVTVHVAPCQLHQCSKTLGDSAMVSNPSVGIVVRGTQTLLTISPSKLATLLGVSLLPFCPFLSSWSAAKVQYDSNRSVCPLPKLLVFRLVLSVLFFGSNGVSSTVQFITMDCTVCFLRRIE